MEGDILYRYLDRAGLAPYYPHFKASGIGIESLTSLTMQDYARVGITNMSDRKRLFELIQLVKRDPTIVSAASKVQDASDEVALSKRQALDMKELKALAVTEEEKENDELLVDWETAISRAAPNNHDAFLSPGYNQPIRNAAPRERALSKKASPPNVAAQQPMMRNNIARMNAIEAVPERPWVKNSKICVAVRKRPLNNKEKARKEADVITIESHFSLTVHEPKQKVDLTKYVEKNEFVFDEVFDEHCTNEEVYLRTAAPLVDLVFQGGKATCFAYGQTGSGKTYTMMGRGEARGIYLLAAIDIFKRVDPSQRVDVSFFEIYGGKLYDLLNGRTKLFARADAKENVNIVGLFEQPVSTVEQLMQSIEYGNSLRAVGNNGTNEESSRSHAILQIAIKQVKNNSTYGKFSFIDLAGSERGADQHNNDRQIRLEGAEINKSLLALKECIRSLDLNHKHIPFRGSKLTEVLKDSFIGNSRTVMIANASPNTSSCEHTLNTLRYADRVKEMKKAPQDRAQVAAINQAYMLNPGRPVTANREAKSYNPPRYSVNPNPPMMAMGGGVGVGPSAAAAAAAAAVPAPRLPAHKKIKDDIPADPIYYATDDIDEEITDAEPHDSDVFEADEAEEETDHTCGDMEEEELERAHEVLINTILEEEEEVIAAHRQHIDEIMDLMKQEMKLLTDVDQPGSAIDVYVTNLDMVLIKKANAISTLRNKLAEFQQHLREEEILSRSFKRSSD